MRFTKFKSAGDSLNGTALGHGSHGDVDAFDKRAAPVVAFGLRRRVRCLLVGKTDWVMEIIIDNFQSDSVCNRYDLICSLLLISQSVFDT